MLHIDHNSFRHTPYAAASFEHDHWINLLRRFIRKELADFVITDRLPTIGDAAKAHGLSVRALQRKLAQQGSSFSVVLDETRSEMAIEALSSEHATMIKVAYDLGFNDQSNFSRAFRRWFGMSPKSFQTCELDPVCKGCRALAACLRHRENCPTSRPIKSSLPGSIAFISAKGSYTCLGTNRLHALDSSADDRASDG